MSTTCYTPINVKNEAKDEIPVPCGKCPHCMKRRLNGWAFRLMKESERSDSCMCVTLTYDTRNVPITEKGGMTLSKIDMQNFMKRLRKISPDRKLKYYVVGEYGSDNWRPHYHMLLYNAVANDVEQAWMLDGKPLGQMLIDPQVADPAVGYCLKYMAKPRRVQKDDPAGRIPEFSLMSKGLGSGYLTDAMKNWHLDDLGGRMYVPLRDGKKIAMPRYYKDKIYDAEQRSVVAMYALERSSSEFKKQMEAHGYNPYDRESCYAYADFLRERNVHAFQKMYKESLNSRKL